MTQLRDQMLEAWLKFPSEYTTEPDLAFLTGWNSLAQELRPAFERLKKTAPCLCYPTVCQCGMGKIEELLG